MKLCTLIECYLVTTFRKFQLNGDNNKLIINFFVVISLLDSTGGAHGNDLYQMILAWHFNFFKQCFVIIFYFSSAFFWYL